MTDAILWEAPVGRENLRLTIREFKGHRFADLRRFYQTADEWRHGSMGCTVPLEELASLGAVMVAWGADNVSRGLS